MTIDALTVEQYDSIGRCKGPESSYPLGMSGLGETLLSLLHLCTIHQSNLIDYVTVKGMLQVVVVRC